MKTHENETKPEQRIKVVGRIKILFSCSLWK